MEEDSGAGESEKLLDDSSSSSSATVVPVLQRDRRASSTILQKLITLTLALLLVLSNVLWAWSSAASARLLLQGGEKEIAYYGSPTTVLTPFTHDWEGMTQRESPGSRYRDEEWGRELFPDDGGVVALSSQFVEEHNLPKAAVTPEDPNKMIYMVAGYHQLHCASVLRDAIYYLNGTLGEWPDEGGFIWDHILHCIEAVRQGLACFLDPTLINLNEIWPGIPNGQLHVCRNRDALRKWSDQRGHLIPVDPREDLVHKHASMRS